MTMRRNFTMALTAAALLIAAVAAPAAVASPASAQAYTCHYSKTESGADANAYAGYYSGMTVGPATNQVTSSGIEAQCLLKVIGFNPGTIDGVFGKNSQAAAKGFQEMVNDRVGHTALTPDGIVGPATWPDLRLYAWKVII